MRAGIAAGRALVSSLRRTSHTPQFFAPSSSSLLSKLSSIAPVFGKEHYGKEFESSSSLWPPCTASFPFQLAMDGHRRSASSFSLSGLERASTGCFRPRSQNYGLETQTTTKTPQPPTHASTQMPARALLDFKASSDSKGSSASTSSSPSPATPSTDRGRPSEQRKTKKSEMLKQMFLGFGAVPFPALVLGAAGLIPFVALAPPLAQMFPLPVVLAAAHADAQAAYGASIVSFLGAIHWGLAMADYAAPSKGGVANMTLMTTRYVWSVVPSLMAWTALLLPNPTKFSLLIFSLWMVLGVDFLFARLKLVPYWYLSLRWPLTLVATVSMIPSMLAAAVYTY